MENFIDNMLESIFGGFNLQINVIVGVVLLIAGAVGLIALKKQSSKGKRTVAWVSIGIGCLGIMSGVIQMLLQ
jgi:hypothetical protein